jgi:hypothetical protein
MPPPVDSNAVLMTGENSFIRLSHDGGQSTSGRLSHWRVLWCPVGAGHALFVQSQLTDGLVVLYSDNAAVARWLQATIETLLFPAFADPAVAIVPAGFTREGAPHATAAERVEAADGGWRLTWSDFVEPFVLTMPPGDNGRPLGVFSTFFPARSAQVERGGRAATGRPWSELRGDRPSSSACLALSETWVAPRG